MSEVYFLSDTHFFHKRIFAFCPHSRKFDTVEQMNEFIVSEWNSVVNPEDVVYHLGDFSFGNMEETRSIFERLNGKNILIKGNHDKQALKMSWAHIYQYVEIKQDGHDVILFHYPIEDWNKRYHGSFHFHGHVHSGDFKPYRHVENRIDIGVDNIGFKPLKFNQIREIMANDTVVASG